MILNPILMINMSLSKEHRLIHRLGPPPGPRMDPGADGPKESLSLDEVIDGGLDHHITKLGEKIKGVEDRIKGLGDLSFSIENKAPNHVVLHVTLRNPKGMAAALAGNPEMINAMMAYHAEEMS